MWSYSLYGKVWETRLQNHYEWLRAFIAWGEQVMGENWILGCSVISDWWQKLISQIYRYKLNVKHTSTLLTNICSGHQTDLRSDIFSLVNLATTPYLCHLILIQKVAILRNHRAGMPCFAGTDLPPKNLILTYYFVFWV